MGCGVFLQSDIVNQQRKGWSAEEIMASLAAVLPLNVWVYAGQLQNLAAAGRKFVLQGGTHRNLAVVKAQVDFVASKVPGAEIVVHPHPGEAGAIGAALCALDWARKGETTRFRGFDTIEALEYTSTTNEHTICRWCPVSCRRTFIDVVLPGAQGRPWSKVPLAPGRERVVSGNTCPRGLLEDANEMRVVKAQLEEVKRAIPMLRKWSAKTPSVTPEYRSKLRIGIPKVLNMWSTHQFWVGLFGALGVEAGSWSFPPTARRSRRVSSPGDAARWTAATR
jgi:hypothetical protein